MASIDENQAAAEKYITRTGDNGAITVDDNIDMPLLHKKYKSDSKPALENICNLFGLSTFEKSLLVPMCRY